ncbi:MAG: tRNA (5-methylaminomethyl-2-thiouridine)(34)-methyltransferase MnmD [Spirosomataceae bacterium]
MSRLVLTADGSHTLWSEQTQQWYHSVHGAWQESQRVFIELGLQYVAKQHTDIQLFEMGFGTGFNALLSLVEAEKLGVNVHYTGVEAFPISTEEAQGLNYDQLLQTQWLQTLHATPPAEIVRLTPLFTFQKFHTTLQAFSSTERYHLIYFDAFASNAQPELWSVEVFTQLADMLHPEGVLTTYSSKGDVRRNLQAAGFRVEKHPGPGRKREVIRAIKH